MENKYPIFIPTKNRFDTRLTTKALDKLGLKYFVVIEEFEYKKYLSILPDNRIILLPWNKPGESSQLYLSRNFIKEYSTNKGYKRHWQLDDNIKAFYRFNNNLKVPVGDGTIFRVSEEFVDRYSNIGLSGFNYFMFASRKSKMPPYYLNTRIYSCTLINNEIPHKYEEVYNDDTDISIRVLYDGWCTILFNAFLCEKTTTMKLKGGNTAIYQEDGRYKMAKTIADKFPEISKITWKFNRWQHHVDYRPFRKNQLIKKPGLVIPQGVNNYGMKLIDIE